MYLLARVIHQSAAEDNGQIPFVLASYLQYGPFSGIITSLRISGSFHRYPVDDNPHPLRMQRFLSVLCCALSLSLSLSSCCKHLLDSQRRQVSVSSIRPVSSLLFSQRLLTSSCRCARVSKPIHFYSQPVQLYYVCNIAICICSARTVSRAEIVGTCWSKENTYRHMTNDRPVTLLQTLRFLLAFARLTC